MLQHCPALFSWPAAERAAVLFGELLGDAAAQRSAAQAGELFVVCPALANTRHIMPSIVRWAAEHHGWMS